MTTITHPERLLQDLDLNRLRALVYREVEDSRQSQYVSLVVIYYVAVLMVARYRDILENETENSGQKHDRPRAATWAGTAQQPLSSVFNPPEGKDERKTSATDIDYTTGYAGTPGAAAMEQRLTLEQRIEMAFKTSCSLLKEILFDFAHYLSRILVGSHGQDLIADGLGSLKSADSTVELVMLLCSQEWQNSLQKHAGTAFMDLVNEGRMISHSTRDRIVVTATEARDIIKEKGEFDRFRHSQFEGICQKTELLYYDENRMYDEFFRAKKRRNSALAETLLEKVSRSHSSCFTSGTLQTSLSVRLNENFLNSNPLDLSTLLLCYCSEMQGMESSGKHPPNLLKGGAKRAKLRFLWNTKCKLRFVRVTIATPFKL